MTTSLDFSIFARDHASGVFDRFGRSVDRSGSKLRGFMSVGAGFAGSLIGGAAAYKAFDFLRDSIDATSDLAESTNKVSQIFGKADKEIFAFSKHAAKALGQSDLQARNAAATFGIFGKSAKLQGKELAQFSIKMTTLAGDLASFHNTSPEEAIEAIGAALRGESEPIRKYGVLLDDATLRQRALKLGLIETTKDALTPQQKVLAAQAEILKQTSDAQGDFTRTSDGLANQQRILSARIENTKAKFGRALLPIMNDVVHFLNKEGLPAFNRFGRWFTKEGVPALQDFADDVRPVAKEILPAIGDAFDTAKDAGKKLLPIVQGIVGAFNDMPEGLRNALLGAAGIGIGAKKLGLLGGGSKGLLGGLVSKASPMPVFVTNPGFGTGGVPGSGKPGTGGTAVTGGTKPTKFGPGAVTGTLMTLGLSQPDVLFSDTKDIAAAAGALEDLAKKKTGISDLADSLKALDEKFASIAAKHPQKPFRAVEAAAADAKMPIEQVLANLPLTAAALGNVGEVSERSAKRSTRGFMDLFGVLDPLGTKVDRTGDKVKAFGRIRGVAHVDVNTSAAEAKINRLAAHLAALIAGNTPFVGGGSGGSGDGGDPRGRRDPTSRAVRDGVRDALAGGLTIYGDDAANRAYLRTGASW